MCAEIHTNKTGDVRVNVILRRVYMSIAAVEGNKYYIFCVCVCSLSYPACNAHVPYFMVICGLSVSTTFLHIISQKERISEKRY